MFAIKIILVLIFLSGFIAYLGDLIGRRIGKKRLTIFNLRPRHTAIIITIFSGILIALITLAIITGISKDARDALFRIDVIKKSLKEVENKYNVQKMDLEKKSKEMNNLKEKWEDTKNETKKIEDEYMQTKKNLNLTDKKLSSLQNTKNKLNKKLQELENHKQDLEEKIESLRGQGDQVFEKLKEVRKELEEVEVEKEKIINSLEEVKLKKLIFKVNQELLKISIPKDLGEDELRKKILEGLKKANNTALSAGAKSDRENEGIIVFQFQIEDLVKKIREKNDNIILRILSSENTVEGEPVFIKFEMYLDRLVFKKGETIIEEIISSQNSQKEIEEILKNILGKVREIAFKKEVLTNPQGEIGDISAIKFYGAIDKIRKSKNKLKLKVIALKDTYRSGPLEVDFIILEISNE